MRVGGREGEGRGGLRKLTEGTTPGAIGGLAREGMAEEEQLLEQ